MNVYSSAHLRGVVEVRLMNDERLSGKECCQIWMRSSGGREGKRWNVGGWVEGEERSLW